MHYTGPGDEPVIPFRLGDNLRARIKNEVVPEVPEDSWADADVEPDFQTDISISNIIATAFPYCDGGPANAVYVLECKPTENFRGIAFTELQKVKTQWPTDINGARRVLYVGVTVNLLRRLHEHLQDDGGDAGADFTQVFPPMRLLHVEWFETYARAAKAEPMVAEELRERFPEDHVAQPG